MLNLEFNQLNDIENDITTHKKKKYSNTIYCFDIETTSLFYIDGQYKCFDYSKNKEYYLDKEKVALPYIFQFSINEKVYYARDFYKFTDVLKSISNKDIHKFVFCHNLAFEFQWLVNILKSNNWHIENVIARESRKIISFTITELNITFRCSYALTNLSLEKCAIEYKCKVKKLVGSLDYNKERSPLTSLTKEELAYCEHDLIVMYEVLQYFKNEYGSIRNIPLTQTGEIRRELNEKYIDFYYHKKMWDNVPEPLEYDNLMLAFMGGITHANFIHSNKLLKGVGSWDYGSDYPFQLCVEKYATHNFFEVREWEIEYFKKDYCLLYQVKLYDIESKLLNHYIPFSKCLKTCKNARFDNGRIIKADSLELTITDIDFEIIKESYNIEKIEYKHIYASRKKYLDKRIIDFLLTMFERKTKLKGIEGQEFSYLKSKQKINGVFGCAVTNPLKQNFDLNIYCDENKRNMWKVDEITLDFIKQKIIDMKKSYSTLFTYSTGVWCTAYARRMLWQLMLKECVDDNGEKHCIDNDVVYYDTDSLKLLNYEFYKKIIDDINKTNMDKIKAVCEYYDIDIKRFSPCDTKGKTHTLGMLEFEGVYEEFKTLGAKKYCVRKNGKLELTVSGVNKKKGVKLLNDDINNFKNGFVFDYSINKLNLIYEDKQESFGFYDYQGQYYFCDNIKYSIIMQPTTYTLSLAADYEQVLENLEKYIYY